MNSVMSPVAAAPAACRIIFGSESTGIDPVSDHPVLRVALPVLAGESEETLVPAAGEAGTDEGWALFRAGAQLGGFAIAASATSLENAAVELYRGLFAVTRGLHLYRVWNYVPRINASESGLENYRRFCRGRSLAFERRFGPDFCRRLPSASSVGIAAGPMAVAFLAGQARPRHFENPLQVPAFEYPSQYGPRPPSFARATVVDDGDGRRVFIAGTAAIRGHRTMATGDLEGQLGCTVENLHSITAAAGATAALTGCGGWQRAFKVYLRRAADLARVRAGLESDLLQPDDGVQYLHADICRADLLVEIEAVFTARG